MWDLKACTVCFSTGVKLFTLNVGTLRSDFNLVSGLKTVSLNGMPEYLCVECTAYVKKFKKFRDKCHRAHFALEQILVQNKEIKKSNLLAFNREQLKVMPSLSYAKLDLCHYEQVQFKLVNYSRPSAPTLGNIQIAHYSTLTDEDTFEFQTNNASDQFIKSDIVKIEFENPTQNFSNIPNILQNAISNSNGVSTSLLRNALESKNEPTTSSSNMFEGDDNNYSKEENDTFDQEDNNMGESDGDYDHFDVMSYRLINKPDGSSLNEEYGDVVPISVKEAKAVVEVNKFTSMGDYHCDCGRRFYHKNSVDIHARRHDRHISGNFQCKICDYYFKTAFLLQCHMTDFHMYKYLCKKCPEVSFSRTVAKQHYVRKHIQDGQAEKGVPWDTVKRPAWLSTKGGARVKGNLTSKLKKIKKAPKDFPIQTPIGHEEQYLMVQQRKESRNYIEAKYKCELCYRGYRLTSTYNKHMAKHDPVKSGNHQCDMCKLYFRDTRRVYKHMRTYHIYKYSCRYCDFVCTSKGQAVYHYRFHKNVTYDCPHCDKKFTKISTQLTHIRFKHPGTDVCNLCGHSFVSSSGLHCHMRVSHTKEEKEVSEAMIANPSALFYCTECKMQFLNEQAYTTHLGSSKKHVDTNVSVKKNELANRRNERAQARQRGGTSKRTSVRGAGRPSSAVSEVLNTGCTTATNCEVCGTFLANDVVARKHYETEHPGTDYLKRYMCDVCGHTTKQYANLLVHMRVHTQEKPYECPHCDRRFSMTSNRDRHLVVHTGEKRYQCQHCSRRFTQSTAVKLHIQTVHMKIPYKPWDKKNRKRRKEAAASNAGFESTPFPVAVSAPPPPVPQHKLLLDTQGEYITYISYADEQ